MDANEIINLIKTSKKKTPVKAYIKAKYALNLEKFNFYGNKDMYIVFGELVEVEKFIKDNQEQIINYNIESDCRNSAIPLLDTKHLNARIEPGAIIRDMVEIKDNAVIMMGAIINIGAIVGKNTMIDMGAVLGGRAIVGDNCHIGANAVLAGVVEPASATPVVIEDDVLIGANAVVIEGVRVGKGAVIAAGSIVIEDVPSNAVVAGVPGRIIKYKDEKTTSKTGLVEALRTL